MSNHTLYGEVMEINEIKTRNDVAKVLKIPVKDLTYVLYVKGVDDLYKSFDIPKKSGGTRRINAPKKKLLFIQKRLSDILCEYQQQIYKTDSSKGKISHGFIKGKSFITNASVHRNKRFVINIDLEDFFDHFHFGRVRGYFIKNEYFKLPKDVATIIAQLTCYNGTLPQGAPTSPIITNLICNILDNRIAKLAKSYHMDYTRYVDDMTFSTNDKKFICIQNEFMEKLEIEINKAGFKINEKKTSVQYRNSRQEVTGVVVNKKLHVNREYYKTTRAMANSLYKNGKFTIDGEVGTINQLEGRFSFINQLEKYNNELVSNNDKHCFGTLNAREKDYSLFLFYKNFFINEKPMIITEGKTDVRYIKAALKNLWHEYPELIKKVDDNKYEYKINFLKKNRNNSYFLDIKKDGADTLNNIYRFYISKKNNKDKHYGYMEKFKTYSGQSSKNAVMILFDNELSDRNKPVSKFAKKNLNENQINELVEKTYIPLKDNLYLMVTPLIEGVDETDIEMFFDQETLGHIHEGRSFCKKDDYDTNKFYGKEIFSKYIMSNYKNIDFSGFKPMLDNIRKICIEYGGNNQET